MAPKTINAFFSHCIFPFYPNSIRLPKVGTYFYSMQQILMVIVLCGLLFGCTHNPVQIETTSQIIDSGGVVIPTHPCSPDTVYFQNDILPLLISNCSMSGCHDVNSHKEDVILTNYSNVINTGDIEAFKPSKSDLYKAITETDPDKVMPPNGSLPPAAIQQIYTWISQGALNNQCDACDTAGVIRYSTHIVSLLQTQCNGCHTGASASGGIDLSTYSGVQLSATNGSLWGAVSHQTGFTAMPQNAAKLSACDLTKFQKWIQNGAQNN